MPQPGEIRRGSTESVQWDGSRWTPLDESFAQQGYHPSVADSAHPWLAAGKGFLSGVAEAATPGKLGLLGALAVPGAGEAALTAAGTQALADFLRVHYKTANAPTSLDEAAGDVGGAALGAGIKGPINAGVNLASKVIKNPQALSGGLGATVGGYEGYKRGGIPGAVEGAILGGAGGTMLGTRFGSLRKAAGLAAEAPEVADAVPFAKPGFRSAEIPNQHYSEYPSSPLGVARESSPVSSEAGRDLGITRTEANLSGYQSEAPIPQAPGERTTWDLPTSEQIKELPLHQQMDYLPSTGETPLDPRGPMPPMQIQAPSMRGVRLAAKGPSLTQRLTDAVSSLRTPAQEPILPSFTHEGQAFQPGEPPAVGGTEIPGTEFSPRGVRDARGDMNAQAIDRLKRAIDVPAVKQDIYATSGDHFGDLGSIRNNGSFDPQLSNYPEPTPSREDLAAELARRLGTPSDADVLASLTTRNTTGKWPR